MLSLDQSGSTLRLTVKDASVHLQEILGMVGAVSLLEVHTATLNDVSSIIPAVMQEWVKAAYSSESHEWRTGANRRVRRFCTLVPGDKGLVKGKVTLHILLITPLLWMLVFGGGLGIHSIARWRQLPSLHLPRNPSHVDSLLLRLLRPVHCVG